jgi:tetratricopeptide (TPR) repeat protein
MPRHRRIRIGVALGLWMGTAALFWPVHSHDFVPFDDPQYVSKNELLEDGLSAAGLVRTFTTPSHFNWHPLTTISYAIDYRLHGRKAGGYLVTNLLLHATATLLLFLALERISGSLGRSAFVAAVFGIHPLHVESVAWVSERKDVLSAVFFAALLRVYAGAGGSATSRAARATPPAAASMDPEELPVARRRRGRRAGGKLSRQEGVVLQREYDPGARRPTRASQLGVFSLLALGLLAKPMLVTVPFVLLLLDFWPLERLPANSLRSALPVLGRLAVEKLPLFVLVAGSAVITFWAQATSGSVVSLKVFPLSSRVLNVPIAYLAYLKRAFWPRELAFFYPMIPRDLTLPRALLATACLMGITITAFRLRRRAPYLITGWLWFLGMLVPVIGLVQVGSQSMADRYTYLPLIGLSIAVAWAAHDLAGSTRAARIALAGVATGTLAALSVATWFQIDTWRNDESLARHALEVTRENEPAHFLLARALVEQGRMEEARSELETAFALWPDCPECHGLLGEILAKEGLPEQAVAAYYEALRLSPSFLVARAKLAQALIDLGRPDEALAVLEQASANHHESGIPVIHVLMGRALEARGDPSAAVEQYEAALRLSSNSAEAHASLGLVLAKQNRLPEAESHLRRALALGLDLAEVRVGLGEVLQRQGRMAEAAEQYRAAMHLRPEWPVPSNNLAWILATAQDPALRRPEEAVTLAEEAARQTRRQDPAVLDTLAAAYAAAGRPRDALAAARDALAVARAQQRSDLVPALSERVHDYESKRSALAP